MKDGHLEIGDRAKVTTRLKYDTIQVGDECTVLKVDEYGVGVQFNHYISGHDCWGMGKMGYCWHLPESRLTFLLGSKVDAGG